MLNINRVRKVLRAYNGSSLYRYNTDTNQFEFYNANLQYKDLMTSRLFTNNPYLNNDGLADSKSSSNGDTLDSTDENNLLKYNPSKLNLIGAGLDFANSILQLNKRGYYGPNGNITLMGDQLVLQGSNMLASVNPALGLGLKAMNTTGLLLNLAGGGTDGVTKFDAWTNTGLGTFLTLGLNGFLGKTSDKFSINRNILANLGGSYGGTYSFMEDAASKANKKYGLFSNALRREANRNSAQSIQYQNTLTNIDKENQDLKSISTNTYDLNSLRYFNTINGIDFSDIRITKTGGKLARIKKLNLHKIGGKIKEEWKPIITEEFIPIITESIDLYEKGGEIKKLRTLEELILYAKQLNPRFILRLSESPRGIKFIDDEGKLSRGSHYLEWGIDDKGNAIVYPRILEVEGLLKLFNPTDAYNRAMENNNYLIMTPDEAKIFFAEDSKYGTAYKSGWSKFFEPFKNGEEVSDNAKKYYDGYDLSNVTIIHDKNPRTEGNTIYINSDEDEIHELWHYLSKNKPNESLKLFYENLNDEKIKELGGDLEFINRLGDPGIFYNPSEIEARLKAAKFKTLGLNYTREFFRNLRANENLYGYNMRDLLHMYNDENLEKLFNIENQNNLNLFKKGGKTEELEAPKIEETTLKNVIPEGALHKNKHHMENTENYTLKGIPVIDNDGELLAEIELNEIIFTLEVTKKLEELYAKYSDYEYSSKEKDEVAIEAGKLLVKEILFNTDDRTGLLKTLKIGGKIDGLE